MKNILDNMTTLNEQQLADIIGLSVHTLRAWRQQGRGPRYRKIGVNVRYDAMECKRYFFENIPLQQSTTENKN